MLRQALANMVMNNEPWGSKGREFLDTLCDNQLLKKNPAPVSQNVKLVAFRCNVHLCIPLCGYIKSMVDKRLHTQPILLSVIITALVWFTSDDTALVNEDKIGCINRWLSIFHLL